MSAPTVGLALIARNEASQLPTLLASIEGAFDEIALVDTGSTDDTVALFEGWAQTQIAAGQLGSYRVDHFDWCDDFSAPRRHADSLLSTDWLAWADCDDEIRGAQNLRAVAAQAPPEIAAFIASYNYAQDHAGNCVCVLKRERLVRAGAGTWQGRVHEAQTIDGGGVAELGPDLVEWVHRKPIGAVGQSSPRNLRILRSWSKDEPDNPRVLAYLGTEELARGKHRKALAYFRRYLKLDTGWDDERAQVYRKYAQALMALGRHDDAIGAALDAVRLVPSWPDSYLTLAEAHRELGELPKAAEWARETLRRGCPETMLIVNPLDYSVAPRVVLAAALGGMGRLDEAIAVAEEALTEAPGHPELVNGLRAWIPDRKRESTAQSFIAAARLLVEHDEQLKALAVLRSVPHYAQDHPQVVAMRSMLRERVDHLFDPDGYADHYTSGGSKPEDMVEDYLAVGDALPRCAFLLAGLREQAAV